MKTWVFVSPVFWRSLLWGIVADWVSKALVNFLIEPVQLPVRELSSLEGKVYPYTPGEPLGRLLITHVEHWREHWYDLDGLFLQVYNIIEGITPFDVPMVLFFLTLALGVPLLSSLSSIGQQRPPVGLSVGLGFWFVAFIGNKGEVLLFGHATDWVWLRFGSFSMVTNLADGMALLGFLILVFGRGGQHDKLV